MFGSNAVPVIVVLTAALVAAVTDVWKFKVYNALTLPLLVAGLLYHGFRLEIADSLLGILFGFAALVPLYIIGGMGAGDVKLMAAIGAWLGMPLTFYVFIASSLAAGVYAIVLMVATGKMGETVVNLHILWLRLASIGRYLGARRSGRSRSQADRPPPPHHSVRRHGGDRHRRDTRLVPVGCLALTKKELRVPAEPRRPSRMSELPSILYQDVVLRRRGDP